LGVGGVDVIEYQRDLDVSGGSSRLGRWKSWPAFERAVSSEAKPSVVVPV